MDAFLIRPDSYAILSLQALMLFAMINHLRPLIVMDQSFQKVVEIQIVNTDTAVGNIRCVNVNEVIFTLYVKHVLIQASVFPTV